MKKENILMKYILITNKTTIIGITKFKRESFLLFLKKQNKIEIIKNKENKDPGYLLVYC